MSKSDDVRVEVDVMGRLLLHGEEGARTQVRPVRLFPLSCPDGYIALLDHDEKELALISDLMDLDAATRRAVHDELEASYLLPQIERIEDIREEFGVLQWRVETDRGERRFDVRSRDDVTFLDARHLLIRDIDGNRYEIADLLALDRNSQARLNVCV